VPTAQKIVADSGSARNAGGSLDLRHDTGQVSTDGAAAGPVLQRTRPRAGHDCAHLDLAATDSKKNRSYVTLGRFYPALCSIGPTAADHTGHTGRDGPFRPLGSRSEGTGAGVPGLPVHPVGRQTRIHPENVANVNFCQWSVECYVWDEAAALKGPAERGIRRAGGVRRAGGARRAGGWLGAG